MPLYMRDGYYKLGEAKGIAFLWIASSFLIVNIMALLTMSVASKLKKPNGNAPVHLSKAETLSFLKPRAFLLAFILTSLLSLAFSMDKKIAFFGLDGWRTGFMTWGFAAIIALFISKYGFIPKKKIEGYIAALCLIVPFLMFLLGIINRFGIYPLAVNGRNNSFLATLGNINWYTGYLSIFVPIGAGLCYREKRFSKGFFACAVYEIVGFATIFLQGSESALLIVAAVMALLAFNGFRDRENCKKFLLQIAILGIGMEIAGLLFLAFQNSYTYEASLLIISCAKHVGLILVAAAVCIYRLGCLFDEIKVPFYKNAYRMILWGLVVATGVVALLFLANNLSDDFGNGRGIIWRLSTEAFSKESFLQKLIGVGQDCYFTFIRSDKDLSHAVYEAFDGSRLTNAHCELLTVLIQTGFVGAAAYLGLIVSSVLGLMWVAEGHKSDSDNANGIEGSAIVFALPIAAYFLNSLVSFSQTTSTPYLFVCIGIGIKIIADSRR
ncbi:O-antigen ligase family protein [Butyrivibrio sp. DSM 10294]|uniref:O-antigen ligase family protein n=1 Tax=Butyrivibrio sp. DSM 10294 TaxID=2972457 RepID=UPI00234F9335|nr:O-antigen ligase family protein [Butyrivibrio sp. DSM 10294]